MSKPVLFVGFRPLDRSENLNAIFEAYQGPKTFVDKSLFPAMYHRFVESGRYDLMVTDDFPDRTPGKCIMVWHGIHGCKTIGLSQPHTPYYNLSMADKMTYIVSAGTGAVNLWSRDTGVPVDRILPLGYAASDLYIGKKKGDGKTILADYKSYLYVPTFRDAGDGVRKEPDLDKIDSMMRDGELFVVKEHPYYYYQKNERRTYDANKYKHIVFAPPDAPTTPCLIDCDVVVTDYSSVMLEGFLCNKPVVLFHDDDDYIHKRGMCFNYPVDYSTYIASKEKGLAYGLSYRAYYDTELEPEEISIRNKLADACDGHSRERICDFIERVNRE